MIIHLLSGPRNISTAMMYSFAQRKDTRVMDEPLYAYYLQYSGAQHPGREEVLASQSPDAEQVIADFTAAENEILFIKHMTHHLSGIAWNFLLDAKNIILLRNPVKVFESYTKVIAQPTIDDLGIKQSFALYHYLKTHAAHFIIADSDDVLKNPEHMLQKICSACTIPFEKQMMHWEPGPRPEDGVWAKYWYSAVHSSSGFEPYTEKDIKKTTLQDPVVQEAMKYYTLLLQHAIK